MSSDILGQRQQQEEEEAEDGGGGAAGGGESIWVGVRVRPLSAAVGQCKLDHTSLKARPWFFKFST